MPSGQNNLKPFSYTMTRQRFKTTETFYAQDQAAADRMVARWGLRMGVSNVHRVRRRASVDTQSPV